MLGRARTPAPDPAAIRLGALTAAVDQALAEIDTALRRHPRNRELADLALDIRSTLTVNPDVPVIPGR